MIKVTLKVDKKLLRTFRGYVNPNNRLVIYTPYNLDLGDSNMALSLKTLVAHEVQHYRQGLERPDRHNKSTNLDLILDEYEAYLVQEMVYRGSILKSKDCVVDKESLSVLDRIAFRYGRTRDVFFNELSKGGFHIPVIGVYQSLLYITKKKEYSFKVASEMFNEIMDLHYPDEFKSFEEWQTFISDNANEFSRKLLNE